MHAYLIYSYYVHIKEEIVGLGQYEYYNFGKKKNIFFPVSITIVYIKKCLFRQHLLANNKNTTITLYIFVRDDVAPRCSCPQMCTHRNTTKNKNGFVLRVRA